VGKGGEWHRKMGKVSLSRAGVFRDRGPRSESGLNGGAFGLCLPRGQKVRPRSLKHPTSLVVGEDCQCEGVEEGSKGSGRKIRCKESLGSRSLGGYWF